MARRFDPRFDDPAFDDEDGAAHVRRLRKSGALPPGGRMSGRGTSLEEVDALEREGKAQRDTRRRAQLAKPSSGGPGWAPTLRPPRRPSIADGSGFALGMVLYALGLNYLRHGRAGVKGWLRAKFLNQPDPTLTAPTRAATRAGKVRPPDEEKLRALPRRRPA